MRKLIAILTTVAIVVMIGIKYNEDGSVVIWTTKVQVAEYVIKNGKLTKARDLNPEEYPLPNHVNPISTKE